MPKVYRNAGEIVACMDWTSVGYQLGVLTIANRQSPMTRFVMHGSTVKYVLTLDFLGYICPRSPAHMRSPSVKLGILDPQPDPLFLNPPLHPTSTLPLRTPPTYSSLNSSRVFLTADGRQFEWRRCQEDPNSYDASVSPPHSSQLPSDREHLPSPLVISSSPFKVTKGSQPTDDTLKLHR